MLLLGRGIWCFICRRVVVKVFPPVYRISKWYLDDSEWQVFSVGVEVVVKSKASSSTLRSAYGALVERATPFTPHSIFRLDPTFLKKL